MIGIIKHARNSFLNRYTIAWVKKQAVSCTITQNGRVAGNGILEDKNGHGSFETQLSTFKTETHLEV